MKPETFRERLASLTKDELCTVIDQVRGGMPIDKAVENLIPFKVKELAFTFHSLLCKEDHEGDNATCIFYRLGDDWLQPPRKDWIWNVQNLMSKYELTIEDIDDLTGDLATILNILDTKSMGRGPLYREALKSLIIKECYPVIV